MKETHFDSTTTTTLERTYPDALTQIRQITTNEQGQSHTYTTTYRYNAVGELVQLDLPQATPATSTSGQFPSLFFEYDPNGNEVTRYSPQGFVCRQQYDDMDNLIRQRAGNEPTHFFD